MGKMRLAKWLLIFALVVVAGRVVIAFIQNHAPKAPTKTTDLQRAGIELGNAKQKDADLAEQKAKVQNSLSGSNEFMLYVDSYTGALTDNDWANLKKYYEIQMARRANNQSIVNLQTTLGIVPAIVATGSLGK